MIRNVLVTLIVAGCSQAPPDGAGWGPLAVDDSQEGGEALIHGTLRVGDECVLLSEAGRPQASHQRVGRVYRLPGPGHRSNSDELGEDRAREC